ncbi:M56 family metallopeptidase [Allocoleopsis franciscana]|uniref:Peptidase M48 domain-containing protein n=1 Tax=Allocoleopsis franciscana PCC 7113 TaxID=1173027 RepID=K9WGD9_9CYAN|nr:M56 family metallopeptidase [Allocoleopsis franciscana]AFZ18854.1 hypothetical protein Mic7113_3104 [Allocoleopsis franciscana PCC 7113]
MHLIMVFVALSSAWYLRLKWSCPHGSWSERWQRALLLLLFPPLLLMMTVASVLCMGPKGHMVGFWDGWLSHSVALVFFGWAGVSYLKLAIQGYRSVQQVRTYPEINLGDKPARLLNTPGLFIAQVGFWQPELIVSQGLLQTLDRSHLEAVLVHEQGHYHYRDTFWFFWFGWLRAYTAWLPNTEALWEELLLLRELRADRWAATQVDSLLLAESLLLVVSEKPMVSEVVCAAFSCVVPRNRLLERIEALLAEPAEAHQLSLWFWMGLLLAILPLLTVPFHT